MKTWITYNWLKLLAIAFVLGAVYLAYAVIAVPFAFYQFMNWIVLGASIVTAVWLFLLVGVTFNPVAPMYFNALVWNIADLVVATLFILSFVFLRSKKV